MSKQATMVCVDNTDLEDILTIGKSYEVKIFNSGLQTENAFIAECMIIADDGLEIVLLVDRFAMKG